MGKVFWTYHKELNSNKNVVIINVMLISYHVMCQLFFYVRNTSCKIKEALRFIVFFSEENHSPILT